MNDHSQAAILEDLGEVLRNFHGREYSGALDRETRFFADLGLKQILSGYYDGDEDGSAIKDWYDKTAGVSGVVGAMYTTWEDKYGAMTVWAKKAWGSPR